MKALLVALPLVLAGCMNLDSTPALILEIENTGSAAADSTVEIREAGQVVLSRTIHVTPKATTTTDLGHPAEAFELQVIFPMGNTKDEIGFATCDGEDLIYHIKVQIDARNFGLSDGGERCG